MLFIISVQAVFVGTHWNSDKRLLLFELLVLFITILAEVPDIIQKKIHCCISNMIENDVLMIFYGLLMSDVVKCA